MIQAQLKLRLNTVQESQLNDWLWHLASVWNWAIRKIELNAKDKIYFSKMEFQNLLADHGKKLGIPSHTMQGILLQAHTAWDRCFKKMGKKPRFKGVRNKLNSVPFPDPIKAPKGNHIGVPGLGKVRFHKMALPEGKIKCGRIIKRASGWYLCLFIAAEPKPIERKAFGEIGIDSGFKHLLTTSEGEIVEHPRELEAAARRLAQAQRGNNKHLAARIQERIANRKKDRNHKLSHRLVAENTFIAFTKDNIRGVAKRFGKSVASSGHYQLRQMLAYKSRAGGTQYVETESRFSTKTCSTCGSLFGPTGLAGLSVRSWECIGCGTLHDRDVNAAINTLIIGAGYAHEVSYACQ
jgi:putative transposase